MNSPLPTPITPITRLGTMILDHIFMSMIMMVFFVPAMNKGFANHLEVSHEQKIPDLLGGNLFYLSLIGFALYFCKDSIYGRSIAKRIFKLQVVENTSGKVAGPLRCFIRNILIVLWPIEVIVALINTQRRLGDRIAGTKLVVYDANIEKTKVNIAQVLISLAIAYGLMCLMMLPFQRMFSQMRNQRLPYVEASYNKLLSMETEQMFSDSPGRHKTVSIRVYEKAVNQPKKYISAIIELRKNDIQDPYRFEQIRSEYNSVLMTKFPEGTFTGIVQYYYRKGGNLVLRTYDIDEVKEKETQP